MIEVDAGGDDIEQFLIKLKPRSFFEDHGHGTVLRLMHRYPDIGSGHFLCNKLNRTSISRSKETYYIYSKRDINLKIHDYMIDEIYTFEEGKKLFPQCYI